jgi:hypothetical protein
MPRIAATDIVGDASPKRLEHVQFQRKLNMLQRVALIAFSDGKPVSSFPDNALMTPGECVRSRKVDLCQERSK